MPFDELLPTEVDMIQKMRLGPNLARITCMVGNKILHEVTVGFTDGDGATLAEILNLSVWPPSVRIDIKRLGDNDLGKKSTKPTTAVTSRKSKEEDAT